MYSCKRHILIKKSNLKKEKKKERVVASYTAIAVS